MVCDGSKDEGGPEAGSVVGTVAWGRGWLFAERDDWHRDGSSEPPHSSLCRGDVRLVMELQLIWQIAEVAGTEVVRTQWLDFSTVRLHFPTSPADTHTSSLHVDMAHSQLGKTYEHGGLLGRRVLIVDEVDDTRRTLM